MPGQAMWDVGVLINEVMASRWFRTASPNYSLGYEDATTFGAGGFTEKAITLADFAVAMGGFLLRADHPSLRALARTSAPIRVALGFPRQGDPVPVGLKMGNVAVLYDAFSENFNRRGDAKGLVGYDANQKPAAAGLRMLGRTVAAGEPTSAKTSQAYSVAEASHTTTPIDYLRDLRGQVRVGLPEGRGRFQIHIIEKAAGISNGTIKLQTASAADGSLEDVTGAELTQESEGIGPGGTKVTGFAPGAYSVEVTDETVLQFLAVNFALTGAAANATLKAYAFYAE